MPAALTPDYFLTGHVALDLPDRRLLGTVADIIDDHDVPGSLRLDVRHFNGEPWPLLPSAHLVVVFPRTYDEGEA